MPLFSVSNSLFNLGHSANAYGSAHFSFGWNFGGAVEHFQANRRKTYAYLSAIICGPVTMEHTHIQMYMCNLPTDTSNAEEEVVVVVTAPHPD